jgi:periplasmic protein TonB
MPVSQVQFRCPLVLARPLPAEKHALLRFWLLSALAHVAVLAMLAIWGGGDVRLRPPPQVITVDLSQMKQPRLADAPSPKPAQKPATPAPVHPVKAVKPQPVTIAAKPQPAAIPKQLASAATTAASSRQTAHWGISATPSGTPSEIPSGTPSGAPSRAAAPAPVGAPESRSPAASSATASGQTADSAGIRTGYIRQCRALIERHKEYPVMARKGMIEGTVVIQGKLARDGALRQCAVAKSSGSGLLDNAALRAVRSVGRFPPLPPEILGIELVFELPVSFQLLSE